MKKLSLLLLLIVALLCSSSAVVQKSQTCCSQHLFFPLTLNSSGICTFSAFNCVTSYEAQLIQRDALRCPKCTSNAWSVHTTEQGYVVMTCTICGYTFIL